jgi:hypothetical protein
MPPADASLLKQRSDVDIPEAVKVDQLWTTALVELADHIGAAAALRLCQARGGCEYYFPKKLAADHDLRGVLGDEVAEYLSQIYGGSTVELPTANAVLRRLRRTQVLARVRQGLIAKSAAARLLETNYRQVNKWLRRGEGCDKPGAVFIVPKKPTNQLDMFRDIKQE